MKTTIILDKSVLFALSGDEVNILRSNFEEIVTRVLIVEIMGGLAKDNGKVIVQRLARKLVGAKVLQASHIELALASLLGQLDFAPGYPLADSGLFSEDEDPTGYARAISRWANGAFIASDMRLGSSWRSRTRRLPMEELLAPLMARHLIVPVVDSVDEIGRAVDEMLSKASIQEVVLSWWTDDLNPSSRDRYAVRSRWIRAGRPPFWRFAPYAYHQVRSYVALVCAVRSQILKKWTSTCLVDLQYLYCLPFCRVFATGDGDQATMARSLSREDQIVLEGSSLKSRLKNDVSGLIRELAGGDES